MLRAIKLDGFRCFANPTTIPLGSLTILTGVNNTGKSSVLQAVMSFVQSEQQNSQLLRLSGEWVQLGSFKQTLNYNRVGDKREFSVGFIETVGRVDRDFTWTLSDPEDPTATTARVSHIEGTIGDNRFSYQPRTNQRDRDQTGDVVDSKGPDKRPTRLLSPTILFRSTEPDKLIELSSLDSNSVLYISAYRDPPHSLYVPRRSDLGPLLGSRGEYTAEGLLRMGNNPADVWPDDPPSESPPTVRTALDLWWSRIFGGPYTIRATAPDNLGFALALDTPSAENIGLGQVGAGLSQALPVVVLSLCSQPEQLIAIESPEIHLHPAAQHRLTALFVALVRAGRQVVLETHSDHIVNAVRLAVKRGVENGGLSPDQVAIHFFTQQDGIGQVERLPLDEHGRLQNWPPGFFDQASETLLNLIE